MHTMERYLNEIEHRVDEALLPAGPWWVFEPPDSEYLYLYDAQGYEVAQVAQELEADISLGHEDMQIAL